MIEKTFRDELAIAAMAAIIVKVDLIEGTRAELAETKAKVAVGAYAYADAMLKARGSEAVKAEALVADDEGWIPHNGQTMPCDGDTRIDAKFRDGAVIGAFQAKSWNGNGSIEESNWLHEGSKFDIVAYRAVK